ncbi:hypothetical protein ACFSKW_05160 [Nonomuraea mangrovi]|uniref:Uncharacterized protein n=1 Tax=Nonomuraea mangrovi TaxID=2316207 RepID=A0ABW4SN95_9ACTN
MRPSRHRLGRARGGRRPGLTVAAGQARLIGCTPTYMNAPGGGAQVLLTFAEEARAG